MKQLYGKYAKKDGGVNSSGVGNRKHYTLGAGYLTYAINVHSINV